MDYRTRWDTEDFDQMSWHDVHVHGFRFSNRNEKEGAVDLILDIDYILEWFCEDGRYHFAVAQAELTFHGVFGLKFSLDYATPTAGMCAFSIGQIRRERVDYPTGYSSYDWKIDINWPSGLIAFQSPGFSQARIGEAVLQAGQWLDESARKTPDFR